MDGIEVLLSGMDFVYFISDKDINWWWVDNKGNSIKKVIYVGAVIEFDSDINRKTRTLKNVKIL